MLSYLWFILYGLIAGILAKTILPLKDEGGVVLTVALGVLGSIVGGWVFSFFGWPLEKGFSLQGLIPAVSGSILILTTYSFLKRVFK